MTSILPQVTEQAAAAVKPNGDTAFFFDFAAGDFAFAAGIACKVSGLERMKNKIEKLLRTALGRFAVYDGTDYGMNYHNWFWQIRDPGFIELELTRETREKLAELNEVTQVGKITCTFAGRTLTVAVKLNTIYGELKEEIIL